MLLIDANTGFEITDESTNLSLTGTRVQHDPKCLKPCGVSDEPQVLRGCLRDAVVVVVGRRGVREHRNEAGFCGATGTRGGRSSGGRRHLDVSRYGHAAALLGMETTPSGVQVLVKLIAVHLAQKLRLAQLV